jgi:tetratricopeptide (TPR) repeat protein
MQRPIFLSGKVVMDDGTPPPEPVLIERVCHGQPRPEGYTDTKGRFYFQLGANMNVLPDASVSSSSDQFGGMGGPRMGTMGGNPNQRVITERDLNGCELRAALPGFRSEFVNLSGRRMMDNPDVGTIVLRRLANVQGLTISATTAMAPKDAKKAFEKGKKALDKKKFEEAERELAKAVQLYPKYALAWHHLGVTHEQQKKVEDARKAYGQALEADAKFVSPYMQLAGMAAQENKWQDVADITSRLISLNPYDFPNAFFYNSVANLNLRNLDEAEKSAREALKLDPQHRNPKVNHVLGVILANKSNYTEAAAEMRNYLQFAPKASDADAVRKQLAEIERLSGATDTAKTGNQ